MYNSQDLQILFPTSFSDACFRSGRAIAQLADVSGISLTIAHVVKPGSATIGTRRDLDSFLAEADHYDHCRRVLIEAEDPVEAVGELCDRERFDLVMAPSSDRLGVHRFFKPSLRPRLVTRCNAPVWTAGKCLDTFVFKQSLRTITCLLDFDCPVDTHLRLATSLAQRTGASLRVITVVEPIHEGTLARSAESRAPLMPAVALSQIQKAFAGRATPEVDIAVGEMVSQLPRLLKKCDSDLLFVGPGQALDGVWTPKLTSYLDKLPCPVVCVDGAAQGFAGWSFESGSDFRQSEPRTRTAVRGQAIAS